MTTTTGGLTATGFVPLQQPEIAANMQTDLQAQFGNIDLSDQSVFGQLVGVFSANLAQLWQAAAALYAAGYPAGATGVAVDNILALANLKRLGAAATVTNPTPVTLTDGTVLYGLRLLGTAGTVVPKGTLVSNGAQTPITFATDADAPIQSSNNAVQTVYFSNAATQGSYCLTLALPTGVSATTAAIPYNAKATQTLLTWATTPSGSYTLSVAGTASQTIASSATAAQVQAAVQALPNCSGVSVTGSVAAGMALVWPVGYVPTVTASGTAAPAVTDAVAAFVHAATSNGTQPFTDVALSGQPQALTFSFGAFPPQSGQPNTQAQPVSRILPSQITLAAGSSITSVAVQVQVVGNLAQAVTTATCTATGPSTVLAGQLSSISTPLSGLTGVTNDLDCLTGRDTESDADAIARFNSQLGSSASASLGSVIKRVQAVTGVTQVVGFQNQGNAAGQVLLFASVPTQGAFSLVLAGQVTASLPYSAQASDVQAAVRALSGLGSVVVTAYGSAGFAFDLSSVRGGQGVDLMAVAQNTTQVALTPYYGRPPHSVEVVVEGGTDADVAQAILDAAPVGIALYSNPVLRTTAQTTAGKNTVTVASSQNLAAGQAVQITGVPAGAYVTSVSEQVVTLTVAATATASGQPASFFYAPSVTDASGNVVQVGFSRPISRLVYITLQLVTDQYVKPGDPTSGTNQSAQFGLASVASIQDELIALVNAVPIGGSISARGTGGLVGSFRNVPGIYDYTLTFDTSPNPTNQNTLALQSNEAPTAQSLSVAISYT